MVYDCLENHILVEHQTQPHKVDTAQWNRKAKRLHIAMVKVFNRY